MHTYHQDIFYPSDQRQLHSYTVAASERKDSDADMMVLLTPHAAYDYIADLLVLAYATIDASLFDRVLFLYPSHQGKLESEGNAFLSVPADESMETPLGTVQFEKQTADRLCKEFSFISSGNSYLEEECALELNLPFIQTMLPKATVLPICCMAEKADQVKKLAGLIGRITQNGRTLTIVSSNCNAAADPLSCTTQATAFAKLLVNKTPLLLPLRKKEISACGASIIEAIQRAFPQGIWQILGTEAKGKRGKTIDEITATGKTVYHMCAKMTNQEGNGVH